MHAWPCILHAAHIHAWANCANAHTWFCSQALPFFSLQHWKTGSGLGTRLCLSYLGRQGGFPSDKRTWTVQVVDLLYYYDFCHYSMVTCLLTGLLTHFSLSLSDISRLKPIKELLPETISYGDIHLTIAIMAVMTGFVRPLRSHTPRLSPPFSQSSSSTYVSPPSFNHSAPWPGGSQRSGQSSNKSWGGSSWHKKKGTKRKIPSSFHSGYRSCYGGKPKAKSKKFWWLVYCNS